MNSIITIRDLKFRYKTENHPSEKLILNIPELDFKTHETVFLFGASGSGKTTLLEILAGVISPDSGEVKILGEDFSRLSLSQKDRFRASHVGYIFQQFNLIPYLTVKENIELPQTFNHKKTNRELYKKLIHALGLTAFENQRADQLSVGQQQRVAAARALIVEPKLILADEPTSALDFDHRENFLKILFQLAKEQNSTVLFVSHDRSIQHLFDRQLNLLDVNIL